MKRSLLILFVFFFTFSCALAQNKFEGKWIGVLKVKGMELGIHFNVKKNSLSPNETFYQTRIDVPLQKLKNYPVDQTSLNKKKVEFEILNLQAKYTGKFTDTNIIDGIFVQYGQSFPLKLTKHWGPLKTDKPQTPKRPLPYVEETVTFSNQDGKIKFSGTITRPEETRNHVQTRRYPAIILFTGSGSQDRDESIGDHKLFAVLADVFTKMGMVVLRVDDRGAGETKMSPDKFDYTTNDLILDGIDYVHFLQKNGFVDTNQIFLLGHSEGGSIAFGVAKSCNIKGIIGLAPPLSSGKDINTFQNFWGLKNGGAPNDVVVSYLYLHEMILNEFSKHDTMMKKSAQIELIKNCIGSWKSNKKDFTKKHYKPVIKYFEKLYKQKFESILVELYAPLNENSWFRNFIQSNPSTDAAQLKIPMLILQGKLDQQIPYEKSKESADQLKMIGRNIEFIGFEGHNHLLQHCKTGNTNEYLSNEETVSEEVINSAVNWLKKQIN